MGDYIFTEDTYAKIQIIKIACSCHNLAPYLTLLKVICHIILPQLYPYEQLLCINIQEALVYLFNAYSLYNLALCKC